MTEKTKVNVEENEKIKTQIDASIGMARSLINSWLPPPKPGEKLEEEEEEFTLQKYSTGRPDRLGLGAKYLSHAEAMRHQNDNNTRPASKQETQLKNKILNQNRRANTEQVNNKRRREESDSEEEEEEKPKTVKSKKKIGTQGDFLSMYLTEREKKKKKKK
ncbi:hypothetical protein G6F46_003393 [Rhizopus delemar]|nr:hypothetical protein G6F54_002709 [Rhizopus delemar]KAG1515268.1 hypothetical protein G6F53_003040 [Rhizopus delemar]KAG1588182.1 hypothetical protein G6F48_005442 [Rhizopus delemar]KAG1599877.1 hypothetical protein G6F47_005112 [Rhizopus delemar]KAG1619131.1 hypothetical protein G6F46_003393 [Rhizopus delemar]